MEVNSDSLPKKLKGVSPIPIWVGFIVTVIYMASIYFLFEEKVHSIGALELNAVGDFLAGFFAPLAFLWLVVSLWLQRSELRQNTEALNLQISELHATVQHQGEIARASSAELKKERPYLYVEEMSMHIENKESEIKEFHLHFDATNSGGPIRAAKFQVRFDQVDETEQAHELRNDSVGVCIRFSTANYPATIFNENIRGVLVISGYDVHETYYERCIGLALNFLELNDRVFEHSKRENSHFGGPPRVDVELTQEYE